MIYNLQLTKTVVLTLIFTMVFSLHGVMGQEERTADIGSKTSYHNQLYFNRFLINPTFSLVREDKSYLNILHRNQYATYEDNTQNYFIGFSNKLNNNTALGLGIYSQWTGVVQEFGLNVNYATSVQLGQKSMLTFGANISYFSDGLDKSRIIASENDPELADIQKENKIAIQPAITLSVGKFDLSFFAKDLFRYNQSTNQITTIFNDKSITAAVQYTHLLGTTRGLFANGKLTPMVQVSRNSDNSLAYVGSVVLQLPKYGWLQTTIDADYGLSAGFGFNLNEKMSLGYLMEKEVANTDVDLGWNHELSVAYTFKNNVKSLADYVDSSHDSKVDAIIKNYEEQILKLMADNPKQNANDYKDHAMQPTKKATPVSTEKNENRKKGRKTIENSSNSSIVTSSITQDEGNSLVIQNSLVLDELIYRIDSLEANRKKEFEQRFESIVRILKNEIKAVTSANALVSTSDNNTEKYNKVQDVIKKDVVENNSKPTYSGSKKYEKLPIRVLNQSAIDGVKTGYYVIANVYKTEKYLNAFMKNLQDEGLNPKKFYNKENGLYYVYLADYEAKQEAESAFVTNLNGKYIAEKWIMQVNDINTSATVANVYED